MTDWELETALQVSYKQGWDDSRDSISNQMRIDEAVESATADLKFQLEDRDRQINLLRETMMLQHLT